MIQLAGDYARNRMYLAATPLSVPSWNAWDDKVCVNVCPFDGYQHPDGVIRVDWFVGLLSTATGFNECSGSRCMSLWS